MVIKSQNESYLMHTGDKGMKWGVRRWRNYDGSLTEAGKERYNYYEKKGQKGVARAMEKNTYAPWDNRKGDSQVTQTVRSAQEATTGAAKVLDAAGVGVRKKNLSTMSDKDLQDAINRGRLESEYAKYYPTTIKTGTRQKLDRILAVTGGLLALGVTASKIYSTVQSSRLQKIEDYDKAVNDAKINSAVKDFMANIGDKKASDIATMDNETFTALKDELKNRAGAVLNMQRFQ